MPPSFSLLPGLLDELEQSFGHLTIKDLIMELRYRLKPKRPDPVVEIEVALGDTVSVDLSSVVGYDIEIIQLNDPDKGTLSFSGSVVQYTAPLEGAGTVAVARGTSREKLAAPRLVSP